MSSSLLPPNATAGEVALDLSTARIGDVPVPLRELWNPQTCPENLLPWLAWALSIDSWKSYWPIEVKRARVAAAIAIQRTKGTAKSVRDVVASFGAGVTLQEWFEQTPPGVPGTFAMQLAISGQGGAPSTAQFVDDILAEVDRTMPVRCHYTFTQGAAIPGQVGVAVVVRPCTSIQLRFTEA